MKKILSIIIILMLLRSNLFFCFQENSTSKTEEMNIIELCILINWELKERKQATKEFIQQQFRKGYSLWVIRQQLRKQAYNTKEGQNYQQSAEIKDILWKKLGNECTTKGSLYDDFSNIINTPACNQMKQDYIDAEKEYKKSCKALKNTPERIIDGKINRIFVIESHIETWLNTKEHREKKIKEILKQKQEMEKKIQELSKKEKEFLNSLFNKEFL